MDYFLILCAGFLWGWFARSRCVNAQERELIKRYRRDGVVTGIDPVNGRLCSVVVPFD